MGTLSLMLVFVLICRFLTVLLLNIIHPIKTSFYAEDLLNVFCVFPNFNPIFTKYPVLELIY